MDDQERERLYRRHRELMERARRAVEEARCMRDRIEFAPAPEHIRSVGLSERTMALMSLIQEARLRSEHTRAETREAVDASRTMSSRYAKR